MDNDEQETHMRCDQKTGILTMANKASLQGVVDIVLG